MRARFTRGSARLFSILLILVMAGYKWVPA